MTNIIKKIKENKEEAKRNRKEEIRKEIRSLLDSIDYNYGNHEKGIIPWKACRVVIDETLNKIENLEREYSRLE